LSASRSRCRQAASRSNRDPSRKRERARRRRSRAPRPRAGSLLPSWHLPIYQGAAGYNPRPQRGWASYASGIICYDVQPPAAKGLEAAEVQARSPAATPPGRKQHRRSTARATGFCGQDPAQDPRRPSPCPRQGLWDCPHRDVHGKASHRNMHAMRPIRVTEPSGASRPAPSRLPAPASGVFHGLVAGDEARAAVPSPREPARGGDRMHGVTPSCSR